MAAVRVVKVPRAAPALVPDASLLEAFCHGMSPTTFLATIYRRQCAHFAAGGNTERVAGLLHDFLKDGNIRALAEATESDKIHCWLRPLAGASREDGDDGRIDSVKVDDAGAAVTLHRAGASLYFRSPPEFARAFVPAMSECLSMGRWAYYDARQGDARGEVETFVSRAGHVTDWHFDFQVRGPSRTRLLRPHATGGGARAHRAMMRPVRSTSRTRFLVQENFTIQLRGRKRWRLRASGISGPIRGATPHFTTSNEVLEHQVKVHRSGVGGAGADFVFAPEADYFGGKAAGAAAGGASSTHRSPAAAGASAASARASASTATGAVMEVVLEPGDTFYFPAGMWHCVEALDDSLSVNISLVTTSWAEVGGDAVRHLLSRDAVWRQMVSLDPLAALPAADAAPSSGAAAGGSASGGSGGASASAVSGAKRKRHAADDADAAGDGASSGAAASASPTAAGGSSSSSSSSVGALQALYSHVDGMLARMRAQAALLRPEHLLPPFLLLSRRGGSVPDYADADGLSGILARKERPAGKGKRGKGTGKRAGDADAGASSSGGLEALALSALTLQTGFTTWMYNGQVVVTVHEPDRIIAEAAADDEAVTIAPVVVAVASGRKAKGASVSPMGGTGAAAAAAAGSGGSISGDAASAPSPSASSSSSLMANPLAVFYPAELARQDPADAGTTVDVAATGDDGASGGSDASDTDSDDGSSGDERGAAGAAGSKGRAGPASKRVAASRADSDDDGDEDDDDADADGDGASDPGSNDRRTNGGDDDDSDGSDGSEGEVDPHAPIPAPKDYAAFIANIMGAGNDDLIDTGRVVLQVPRSLRPAFACVQRQIGAHRDPTVACIIDVAAVAESLPRTGKGAAAASASAALQRAVIAALKFAGVVSATA